MTRYPLQFPRLWLAMAWALVAVVVVASLIPGQALKHELFRYDKLLHTLAYGSVMVGFAGIYRPSAYRWIAPALLLLGIGLEFAQGHFGHRSYDLKDMFANAAGVLIGLLLARFVLGGWCARMEHWWLARRRRAGEGR